MIIHSGHPFPTAEDPVRRLRGRVSGTVSLWTAGSGAGRTGLTVSSVMVANGDPAHVLGLVDPDSDLADALVEEGGGGGRAVVQLLEWEHRDLAEAFAGLAPAPGGLFRLGSWEQTEWGPLLSTASAWVGVRLISAGMQVGWSLLVDGVVEHVAVGESHAPLVHRRGRYQRPG